MMCLCIFNIQIVDFSNVILNQVFFPPQNSLTQFLIKNEHTHQIFQVGSSEKHHHHSL